MSVAQVDLRLTTPEESAYAHRNSPDQSISAPIWRYFQNQPSTILEVWTSVRKVFGYRDAALDLTRRPCTNLVNPNQAKAIKAILKPHSKEFLLSIREECVASFNEIADGEQTNATELGRRYFTRCFSQNIFINDESGIKLNNHLNTFTELVSKHACNQRASQDAHVKQMLFEDIHEITSEILAENPDLFSVDISKGEKPLSDDAKRALVFLAALGAHDPTIITLSSATLSSALWYLAAHPQAQEELRTRCQEYQKEPNGQYPDELNRLFFEIMQQNPLIPRVSRVVAQDPCLEFTRDLGELKPKPIIFTGGITMDRVDKIGKKSLLDGRGQHMIFGHDPYRSPGTPPAQSAVKEFLAYTLANYQIDPVSPRELNLAFTTVFENDIEVVFNKL